MDKKILFIRNYINKDVLDLTLFSAPNVSYIYGGNRLYGGSLLNKLFNLDKVYQNYDYLVFVDEDCKISFLNSVYEMIDFMEEHDYDIAGPADGKDQPWVRGFRYDVPNLFFVIIKTAKMKKTYSSVEFACWKIPFLKDLSAETNTYEPYYKVLTYLIYSLGMKYYKVKCIQGSDKISTILSFNETNFAIHTWFTRFFNSDKSHHERIIKTLKEFI